MAKVRVSLGKSVQANAADYYEEAKKAKRKAEGLEKAIEETRRKAGEKKPAKKVVRVKRERKWYEEYRWAFTTKGKLIVAGKSAAQNDRVFSQVFREGDFFFHADIKGGAATVLKEGEKGERGEKMEAAALAACYSKAWVKKFSMVDVYCLPFGKVRTAQGAGAGAFDLLGKREWFRNTPLRLAIGLDESGQVAVGAEHAKLRKKRIMLPGKLEKGEAAKRIAERLGVHPDEVLPLLPPGKISVAAAKLM